MKIQILGFKLVQSSIFGFISLWKASDQYTLSLESAMVPGQFIGSSLGYDLYIQSLHYEKVVKTKFEVVDFEKLFHPIFYKISQILKDGV